MTSYCKAGSCKTLQKALFKLKCRIIEFAKYQTGKFSYSDILEGLLKSMAINDSAGLSPTETLILELLIARYRLGEALWTFDATVRKQVRSLASKGYVHELNGIVERTVRARLTDEAIAQFLSYDYVPPIAQGDSEMTAKFKAITDEAVKLKEQINHKAA